MLILSRKENEKIIIGAGEDIIVITVLNSKSNQIKIGLDAPDHITIHREEIWNKINNKQ